MNFNTTSCSLTYIYIIYVTVLALTLCVTNGQRSDDFDDRKPIKPGSALPVHSHSANMEKTVSRFARRDLCRLKNGQIYFYNTLKTKICNMDDLFVEAFVFELCNRKGKLLEMWTGALFDLDKDGLITDLEREFYNKKYI